ncbi:cell wall hydrolase SleB-like protein (plasmid) [Rhizobium etli bv. mimosae str. IE4771]|uniref:Cell wall hydrolase SleB-like protein n=1 Tax=Rhizobium etli bv. mimosae str. IE4771 TaxID=1432050 RepID=A0A060IH95_RHIET|nr:cell wall hydrolase [Rhizobium sp. IE4771]AIC31325.1 cell wall hydrolase SleB-like protein [Rhizobium sp. IE4771]
MKKAYVVINPNGGSPATLTKPDVNAALVDALAVGDLVYIEDATAGDGSSPSGWREAEYRVTPTATGDTGWLQTEFIGEPAEFAVNPIAIPDFVRRCGRAEIQASAGGSDAAPAILADYLIALALIESDLTKFENRLPGTSSIGPFQITWEEWEDFLSANPDGDYSPFQRFQALAQVQGAIFLAQRDWGLLQQEAKAASISEPKQEYIPSFLLLFQSRLIGAKAAFALNALHDGAGQHTSLRDALTPFFQSPDDLNALLKRRKDFLNQGSPEIETTVDEFVEKTANVLASGFKSAFKLLKEHFPEFVAIPAGDKNKPWLTTAQQEEATWKAGGLTETNAPGKQRIQDYFAVTSYHPTNVKPWCGAFVAWCLSQNNQPTVTDAATASSWKRWGTFEIRKGALSDPDLVDTLLGAVVVLHPSEGTGTTGHVCFAINTLETANKLKCIGGNQDDTVRTDTFDVSRVASIRALVQIDMPVGSGQLILARTIFGEAASEPDDGKEAVAQVVMNRTTSGRYPTTVTSVCLQPWQFSCWNANDPNRAKIMSLIPGKGNAKFDTCFAIAGLALNGAINRLPTTVLHYHADYISKPSWVLKSPNAVMVRKIGRHLFYRGIR